jgi:tripartite-type tricarboxylate transporter receptor subunit TctC
MSCFQRPLPSGEREGVGGRGALILLSLLFALSLALPSRAAADEFYRGRTLQLYIGFGVGGSYDLYGRMIARHMGKHIPGAPEIVAQNMPGAGGLRTANYMAAVAPKDGTALAITSQTVSLDQLFGVSGVAFDARKFNWIGRITTSGSIFFTWHTSGTKTFADALVHVTTMGSSGSGDTADPPRALDRLAGAKFKLVMGYRGSNDVALAVERGEIDGGYALWSDFKFRKADWIRDKQANLLFLVAGERDPQFPDLPTAKDLVKSDEGKQILGLFQAPSVIGRAIFTTPGVPAARVAVLRQAFAATLTDPAFLAEAKKVGLVVDALDGARLQADVSALLATPPDLVKKADAARQPLR